jgi:hypothetical protein
MPRQVLKPRREVKGWHPVLNHKSRQQDRSVDYWLEFISVPISADTYKYRCGRIYLRGDNRYALELEMLPYLSLWYEDTNEAVIEGERVSRMSRIQCRIIENNAMRRQKVDTTFLIEHGNHQASAFIASIRRYSTSQPLLRFPSEHTIVCA